MPGGFITYCPMILNTVESQLCALNQRHSTAVVAHSVSCLRLPQVQGKDPSVDITQEIVEESEDERFDDVSDSNPWVELPPCEIGRLEDINEVMWSSFSYVTLYCISLITYF